MVLRRRQTVFYPIAAAIVVVSGILLLGFITFEKTAIETVPPAITGVAYVPYTPTPTLPPTLTPIPTVTPAPSPNQPTPSASASASWDTTISPILSAKCAACHIKRFNERPIAKDLRRCAEGGKSGPAIVPGDPDKSVLVQVQQKGGHSVS